MTSQNRVLIYTDIQNFNLHLPFKQANFVCRVSQIHSKIKSSNPCKKILIFKNDFLSLTELQLFHQLKIEYPFIELYFYSNKKLTFKNAVKLIEAEITQVSSVQSFYSQNITKSPTKQQNKIILRRKEKELFDFFRLNQGKILTKDLLLSAVWGYKDTVFTRTLECHISSLRTKIKDNHSIQTVHGQGYLLELTSS